MSASWSINPSKALVWELTIILNTDAKHNIPAEEEECTKEGCKARPGLVHKHPDWQGDEL